MTPDLRIRKIDKNGSERYELDLRSIGEGRKFFRTESEAREVKKLREGELREHGASALTMSHEDRLEFIRCRDKLAPLGMTMAQAVDFVLEHHHLTQNKAASEAVAEFLDTKRASGKRPRYVEQIRYTLESFFAGREELCVHQFRREDVESYLNNPQWMIRTKRAKLIDLGTFFSWCAARGFCRGNPTEHVERFVPEHKPPGILTPEQAEKLMLTTQAYAPRSLPYVTLCLFAGLRPAEVLRIGWESVDLDRCLVRVEGAMSKTRQRRIVTLEPNAVEWLKAARDLGGALPPTNWKRNFDRVRDISGLSQAWAQDAMRHSYVSYSFAVHGAAATARNAGHSEQILFRHYRELVTPEQAKAFWGIRPVPTQPH